MKFLGNALDPKLSDDELEHGLVRNIYETPQQAVANHRRWLAGKIIAPPMGNEFFTMEQLERMNLVGVYTEEPNEQAE